MKINPNLKVRVVAGEAIVLLQGNGVADYTKVLALNSSSKYLWDTLFGKDFTEEDVVSALLEQYEVDVEQAQKDATAWVAKLKELSVIAN